MHYSRTMNRNVSTMGYRKISGNSLNVNCSDNRGLWVYQFRVNQRRKYIAWIIIRLDSETFEQENVWITDVCSNIIALYMHPYNTEGIQKVFRRFINK